MQLITILMPTALHSKLTQRVGVGTWYNGLRPYMNMADCINMLLYNWVT